MGDVQTAKELDVGEVENCDDKTKIDFHGLETPTYRAVPLCWYKGCGLNCRYFCELCVLGSQLKPILAGTLENSEVSKETGFFHRQRPGECRLCAGTGLGSNLNSPICLACAGTGNSNSFKESR